MSRLGGTPISEQSLREEFFARRFAPLRVIAAQAKKTPAKGLRPLDPTNKDENNEIHPKSYDRTGLGTDFIIFD